MHRKKIGTLNIIIRVFIEVEHKITTCLLWHITLTLFWSHWYFLLSSLSPLSIISFLLPPFFCLPCSLSSSHPLPFSLSSSCPLFLSFFSYLPVVPPLSLSCSVQNSFITPCPSCEFGGLYICCFSLVESTGEMRNINLGLKIHLKLFEDLIWLGTNVFIFLPLATTIIFCCKSVDP